MKKFLMAIAMAPAMMVAGCTFFESNEVIRPNEERVKVKFENENASKLFNEMVNSKMSLRKNTVKRDVGISGARVYKENQKLSDNAFWNDEVKKCDINGDLFITEREARIYSNSDPFE